MQVNHSDHKVGHFKLKESQVCTSFLPTNRVLTMYDGSIKPNQSLLCIIIPSNQRVLAMYHRSFQPRESLLCTIILPPKKSPFNVSSFLATKIVLAIYHHAFQSKRVLTRFQNVLALSQSFI